MRAAVMQDWKLTVADVPDPHPGAGQYLARVKACGICGSDLHMLVHGARQLELRKQFDRYAWADDPTKSAGFEADQPCVMGHEFSAEVLELGPDCSNVKVGDLVVSMPIVYDAGGFHAVGYSNRYNGGYADLIVLNDPLALKVPNGLPARIAALTEPLAVGVHAVNKSGIRPGEAALVMGCGPVGLACIAGLAAKGIEPIIAADFSPRRRELAARLGAQVVVDPRTEATIEAWRRTDPAWHTKGVVIFEAVGVPGMITEAMLQAPRNARILVVGVCMEDDTLRPMLGIRHELTMQFALGYDPAEFASALTMLADGTVDAAPLITAEVPVDGVPQAFADLANPEAHAKILVVPGS